jgi:hypothetical protein
MPFAASDAYFRLQEPTTGSASGTGTTRAVSMRKTLVAFYARSHRLCQHGQRKAGSGDLVDNAYGGHVHRLGRRNGRTLAGLSRCTRFHRPLRSSPRRTRHRPDLPLPRSAAGSRAPHRRPSCGGSPRAGSVRRPVDVDRRAAGDDIAPVANSAAASASLAASPVSDRSRGAPRGARQHA